MVIHGERYFQRQRSSWDRLGLAARVIGACHTVDNNSHQCSESTDDLWAPKYTPRRRYSHSLHPITMAFFLTDVPMVACQVAIAISPWRVAESPSTYL